MQQTSEKIYSLEDFLDIKVSNNPSFSPDGTKITYLNNTPGTFQLYLANVFTKEIKQLTDYRNRLLWCSFSPTEDKILFGMDNDGDENTQLYSYDVVTDTVLKLTDRNDSVYKFGDWSMDGTLITYASNESNGTDFDIYVKDLTSGKVTCVFKEHGWCESLGFSPDKTQVVVRQSESSAKSDLYLVNLSTLSASKITHSASNTTYDEVCWLGDSSGFFVINNEDSNFARISVYNLGEKRFAPFVEFDWDVEDIRLSPNQTKLVVVLNKDGCAIPHIVDVTSKAISQIKELDHRMSRTVRWSNDSQKIVFASETSQSTRTIYTYELATQRVDKISETRQKIPGSELISPELIRYKTFDGLDISAFLYMPTEHDNVMLPVIISIHGGPESQYRPFFDTIFQFFLHNGYAVVAPNVRGSSGYGKHYMSLDDKAKRLDSVRDIVWLKKHLDKHPRINNKKMILMGGSYGGYMVLANLAFFPEHWLAGIDIVGMANFVTFLQNTSDYRRAHREAEYGSLEHDRKMLESISPIHKVGNIKSPLFIVHGANDSRVPLSETEQMYDELTSLGRDVEMLVFDDEGHGVVKLNNRVEMYTKVFNFLEQRLETLSDQIVGRSL